jgi:Asp/Glu/hydantoin racemase
LSRIHIGPLARIGQRADSNCMARILVVNPNSSTACSAGIADALAPFCLPNGPAFEVATLAEGPPAIYDWRDWHGVVQPLCDLIGRVSADAYVIACASDPGIEAARAVTDRPVFGVFRCAVAAAAARAERFGVIAIVDASKARHLAALRAMGLESRLAAEVALNVTMETLLEPDSARARLIDAARACAAAGAGAVILGCTGMAHHRAAVEDGAGVPVIEPCQAAAAIVMASLASRDG